MSEYGTSEFTLADAIRGARVSRVRKADLEMWGKGVQALQTLLQAMARLDDARRMLYAAETSGATRVKYPSPSKQHDELMEALRVLTFAKEAMKGTGNAS